VFNLLMIDPLAQLDPATRELANTRMLGERGLFMARHMPTLIRRQTELLAIQTAEVPQIEKLLANTAQLTQSVERFAQVSEKLPAMFREENERILGALKSERQGLTTLATQTKEAMAEGKSMSQAVNTAFKSFQEVLKQLESGPDDPASEPFRIKDYTVAAAQIGTSAQHLAELLDAFQKTTSPEKFSGVAEEFADLSLRAESSSKAVVDYAFQKFLVWAVAVLAAACVMVTLTVLGYRMLARSLGVGSRQPGGSEIS
jgi:hypothetical protein